jgi:hypothetical protein
MADFFRVLTVAHALVVAFTFCEAFCVGADADSSAGIEPLPTTIDTDCRERFLKEAPAAWKTLRERLNGIELDLTYADHHPTETGPDPEPLKSTYCILKDGVSRRLDRGQSIDVTNSRYSFKLKVSESASSYSLAEVEPWHRNVPQPLVGWLDVAEQNLSMGSNIWWMPIEKVLVNDDFKMTGAAYGLNKAGEDVVRIVYRYTGVASDVDPNLQPDGVYWSELLPKRFWVVESSGLTSSLKKVSLYSTPFRTRVTTRFQEWNGVPLPEEVRIEAADLRTNVVLRVQRNRFGPPRECTRSNKQFFLPHYGISEASIPQIESGLPDRRLGILAAGVVFLILAWVAYKRSKIMATA